ncbi:MAG: tetratricopeptide repeat protein [Anaerolineae bacterium]|nr:tetratricopeptide repeat protein [Anaerolineae bacterium]
MNPNLLILLVSLLFILVFGGLPVLRKEEPSLQLAVEVLVLTGLSIGASLLTGLRLDPIFFLIFLYLIIMRCRVLIDLGNLLSSRGHHQLALSVYRLAMRLGPDFPIRLIALISYGAVLVRVGALEEAIRILEEVLEKGKERLQLKHESACHYNLGVAYLRMGRESRAVREFNETIDAWPLSPYAQGARAALERRRSTGRLVNEGTREGEEKGKTGDEDAA